MNCSTYVVDKWVKVVYTRKGDLILIQSIYGAFYTGKDHVMYPTH
jgi:hypothetical protein